MTAGRSITALLGLCLLTVSGTLPAGFHEDFEAPGLNHDPAARDGWAWMTGDGAARMHFSQADGTGRVEVDAREDTRNIWWAFVRRSVSSHIDAAALARPDRELRVEARVRSNTAPRRVNLHFNHSRTTDFHSHLMEYDLPDTENWHVISMTTKGFDARPGDEVFVQLALMDWGLERYQLEIDYLRVDVADPAEAGPDLGPPLPYRPQLPPLESYRTVLPAQAATVDSAWPETNLGNWGNAEHRPLAAVGGTKTMLLRFEPGSLAGSEANGWGALELTTEQLYRAETGQEEFGMLRVTEVLSGDPQWDAATVTWQSLLAGNNASEVFNAQMMIDVAANPEPGGKTTIPVSPPVLQRLLSGRTRGLAIRPLGAIEATFFTAGDRGPRLHINTTAPGGGQQENQP